MSAYLYPQSFNIGLALIAVVIGLMTTGVTEWVREAALLGGNSRDALLLAIAVGCALVALAVLAPPSQISARRLSVGSAAIGATVVLMVLLRQREALAWL
ncbi:MAG: hypothetical protein HY803_06315 [candidate division NC10 bacterium]|nr:hypothetical protein [candidate division NC10 bacterium]